MGGKPFNGASRGSSVRKAIAITPVSFWQKAMSSGVGWVGVETVSLPKRMARWGRRLRRFRVLRWRRSSAGVAGSGGSSSGQVISQISSLIILKSE
ncbi:MAG: hypothetical protein P5676_10835 [Limnospira sp. PMC 1252.20]|nr:hypothetical protein [Limnospira sp. PMC 1252.20]